MKTNERMTLALIAVASCSFFFGLGQQQTPAAVSACPKSCCEPLYSWWNSGTTCYSAQVAGATFPFVASANTTTAITSVYLAAATPGGCKLQDAGLYDRWEWPDFTPVCAAVKGVLPTTQSATVQGSPPVISSSGEKRTTCVVP